MPYIQGESRDQLTLTPMCLDDYIEPDSICRVIAAYVDSLDLVAMGFKYAETKDTGRPPFDPAGMLTLYLYGYQNRIRSSRRLNAETKRNVEVMWLMGKLTPDDKTICNFRKDNTEALKKVFREFSLWCNRQGLYGKELVGVDSTKIRANSSRKNIHTKKGTEKDIASVKKKISEYMKELETNDTAKDDGARLSPEAVHETLKRLNEKKDKFNYWKKQIEENDGKEISTVDPDARIMHQGGNGRALDACYNVQTVVDAKHKLIVGFEVTTIPDEKDALPEMTECAKGIMGIPEISVVADKGYYDGEDISKCETAGTTCYVPKSESGIHAPDPDYDHEKFVYNQSKDSYLCPQGFELTFQHTIKPNKGNAKREIIYRIYRNDTVCKGCSQREKCTKNKRLARTINRSPNQDALDAVNVRMLTDDGRKILQERKKIVEHPFGTIKCGWGFGNYLCRGLEKATAEQSLTYLAYNLRRVFNIFKENGDDLIAVMS